MIMKRKVFFAWNMEKEKEWLEEQAKLGCVLKDIKLFKYYFEEGEPQDLVYQFDFQALNRKQEKDYLELFEDWTFVTRFGGWYYFSKQRSNDQTDLIYSNNKSKKTMFYRLIGFLFLVAFPLYYQVIFMFPNMDDSRFEYPSFYFFFRIIILGFLALHTFAVIRLLLVMRQYNNALKE